MLLNVNESGVYGKECDRDFEERIFMRFILERKRKFMPTVEMKVSFDRDYLPILCDNNLLLVLLIYGMCDADTNEKINLDVTSLGYYLLSDIQIKYLRYERSRRKLRS